MVDSNRESDDEEQQEGEEEESQWTEEYWLSKQTQALRDLYGKERKRVNSHVYNVYPPKKRGRFPRALVEDALDKYPEVEKKFDVDPVLVSQALARMKYQAALRAQKVIALRKQEKQASHKSASAYILQSYYIDITLQAEGGGGKKRCKKQVKKPVKQKKRVKKRGKVSYHVSQVKSPSKW